MDERTRDTRRALIAAASDLLAQGGPAHVTLRAVGAAADVSRTAPYRHFQDKDDLLSTVAAESLASLTAEMRRAVSETTTTSSRSFEPVSRTSALPGSTRTTTGSSSEATTRSNRVPCS
ncbi:TetR/AcrR family transcriptional regulator [Prescottella defluvii]|nr:TetR/AcrR family transcriptional regulator [Prescottella defluvii]